MRAHSLLISMLLLLVTMGACNSGSVMTNATGFAYEVVVVMDQKYWDGVAGAAIKSDLASPVPGLPQAEPSLKITYAPTTAFDGLLTYVRSILIVKIDPAAYTKVSVSDERNRWARGQVVLTMTAPSSEAVAEYVENNKYVLVDYFVKAEMERVVKNLDKSYSGVVMDGLKKKFDAELKVPSDMTYFRDTTDFFWASNNANTGRTDLIVYSFPYTDPNTFTPEYLVAKRDSVLKANLPGAFPDSYMATETRFGGVDYKPITVNGKYCGEMRGLWKMEGDMMGGPFVSRTRLDEKNNRVIVAEGFVFAPETNKRNFIRRIEAALHTLRLPGETAKELEDNSLEVPEEKK